MKDRTSQKLTYNHQLKLILLIIFATLLPFYLVLIFFQLNTSLPLSILTRDPAATGKMAFYVGFFSNIGVLLWCSCVAICIFTSILLKKDNKANKFSPFLLYSGLLTLILLLDDFLLLHENVFPKYLGINSIITFLIYILIALAIFIKNIKIIKKTEFIILLSALVFLGLSIICDVISDRLGFNINIVLEDQFKILGITSWFIYFTRVCFKQIGSTTHS